MKKLPRKAPVKQRPETAIRGDFANVYDFRPDLRPRTPPEAAREPVLTEALGTYDRLLALLPLYGPQEEAPQKELRDQARALIIHITARVHQLLDAQAAPAGSATPLPLALESEPLDESIGHDALIARAEGELAGVLRKRPVGKVARTAARRPAK